jgi:membrane protease YdiL (CAAX protease family)
MSVIPPVFKDEDPFNVWMKRAAPIAVLILLPLVVLLQQFSASLRTRTIDKPPIEVVRREDVPAPGISDLAIESKFLIKQVFHVLQEQDPSGNSARRPWDITEHPEQAEDAFYSRSAAEEAIAEIDKLAVSRTDRFRAAIVAGELLGPAEAATRLAALSEEVNPDGDLAKDIGWLRPWYEAAAEGKLDPLPQDVQDSLRARHAWFADLALSHQKPAHDPLRWSTVSGAERLDTIHTAIGLWSIGGLFLGAVLAVIVLVRMREHTYGITETLVPCHLYTETFALFLLGFVTLDCIGLLLLGQTSAWAFVVHEVMLWLAVLAVFWPLLRGVTMEEFRIDVGLTGGEDGIKREIAAGFVGYFAGIPLLVIAGSIMAALSGDVGDGPATDTKFPLFERPLTNSWVPVVFSAISACIWAPIFEEIFFRGCIHRTLHRKIPLFLRVLTSATVFGIVHPYDVQGIIEVGLNGLVYGYMRECRVSIIGPMLAHALHNGTIIAVQIGVLLAIG